jgi:type II secretory pathway pseudopilin PulG
MQLMPTPASLNPAKSSQGFTYVEMLITVSITAIIMVALMGVVNTAAETGKEVLERTSLVRDARFAMARMVRSVSHSQRLLLPLRDNPNTDWPENLREQTVPASPPLGSSTLATAVLAITLALSVDLDGDGIADADNDGDGLIDEDLPKDNQNDSLAGIGLIDDDGDGSVDEIIAGNPKDDNDEDGIKNEDPLNGLDDDGDGSIDEDANDDSNGDTKAGIVGVDDDADGAIDEGDRKDDDEDGAIDEDWYDAVVFFLQPGPSGTKELVERTPVPWDNNADTQVDGADYNETTISSNVTRFRVERISTATSVELVDITLELTDPRSGESISLQTRVRLGGGV